ncbi:MAG: hypothetical protein IJ745_01215 [Bacteroidales bacterium]|nr:hypothetical protein [Bacteroidales bacterium]
MKHRFFLLMLTALLLAGCSDGAPLRAVYHWKTTYDPTQYELQWLRDHHVQRLYLRLFDVALYDCPEGAAPIATTRFMQPLPDGMEVVPVVYITNEAMREMSVWAVAERVAERVKRMADCQGFGLTELQVDCDWTQTTKGCYYRFCDALHDILAEDSIRLSSTVRLHQVDSTLAGLSVDSKVLMLYNTGDLRSPQTANSILDYNDVAPYLHRLDAGSIADMGVAWPVFGWGVVFDGEGRFRRLVPSSALDTDSSSHLRVEWGRPDDIRRVQHRLPRRPGGGVTVLYHLDSLNLSKYTYDEIEDFYRR